MNNILSMLQANVPAIIIGLSVVIILLLLFQLILYRRFKAVSIKYKLLTRGPSGADLEQILNQYVSDVKNLEQQTRQLAQEQNVIKGQIAESIHNIGLVRFNAFENMGSDLSFSMALLDRKGDGVVLTGLYGRDETRVYAKPLRKGTSDYSLAEEEQQAIKKSMDTNLHN